MINYTKKFSLKGKQAVVAGGAGLIGKEIVTALSQAGARVVIAEIDKVKGKDLERQLSKHNLNAAYRYFDITDIKKLEKNIAALARQSGGLDIWVNSAYPRTKDWAKDERRISCDSWRKNIDMHLNSYALSSKYVATHMVRNGGAIINLSSIYGVVGPDFSIYEKGGIKTPMIYAAIKGAIVNLDRYLASYFGKCNIRINTICPGGVFDKQNPAFVKNYSRKTPLRRMAFAEEVASTALFLASEAASYITGATIMVDGGWTAI